MPNNAPHNALRHHVSGAIARGEAQPIIAVEAYTVAAFFRCECGKLHSTGSIGPLTTCACGADLWRYVFNVNN